MGTKERLEILTEHYKNCFPDDIEAIVMTKDDYERQFGNTFETITKETVINDLLKRISDLEFEVERLNNIINELEKTLNNYDLDYMDLVGEHLLADILEDLKNKLQELKGSDK